LAPFPLALSFVLFYWIELELDFEVAILTSELYFYIGIGVILMVASSNYDFSMRACARAFM
jgi:hypothetical protein